MLKFKFKNIFIELSPLVNKDSFLIHCNWYFCHYYSEINEKQRVDNNILSYELRTQGRKINTYTIFAFYPLGIETNMAKRYSGCCYVSIAEIASILLGKAYGFLVYRLVFERTSRVHAGVLNEQSIHVAGDARIAWEYWIAIHYLRFYLLINWMKIL